ncbi:MAG: hypothetical protein MK101_04235 [Phycisphaerales bacterium]|nr:hypothetical protein [Phycisphaerales bacterium]
MQGCRIVAVVMMAALAGGAGCSDSTAFQGARTISLGDFSDPSLRDMPIPDDDAARAALQAAGLTPPEVEPPVLPPGDNLEAFFDVDARPGEPVVVDSLIGQVNGRPIYADEVIGPITDQLRAEYERMAWQQFQPVMERLVMQRLQEVVLNELFLAEARASMSEQQQHGLLAFMRQLEQDLVGKSGGVQRQAEQDVLAEEGRTIEEYMQLQEERVLIETLMNERVRPKAVVSWRDVEREYEARHDEFNPAARIVVGRIRLRTEGNEETITAVGQRLAAGESFGDVAADVGMADRGVWETFTLPRDGIEGLEIADVYKPILEKLSSGETSPAFERGNYTMWLSMLDRTQGEARSLFDPDVQQQLQQELYGREMARAQGEFINDVLQRGIYEDLNIMHQRALAITATRFPPR